MDEHKRRQQLLPEVASQTHFIAYPSMTSHDDDDVSGNNLTGSDVTNQCVGAQHGLNGMYYY